MSISETIFKNKKYLIPMADVQFIEYRKDYAIIVMKHSQWSNHLIHGYDEWLSPLTISGKELKEFEKAYCLFRHELDEVNTKESETNE
jgi:hypothetical protein